MQLVKNNSGFTLIETLLYIGLMAILIGGGMIGVYNILEGAGRTKQSLYREQEAYFITRKVDAVISESTSISEPSPGGNSSFLLVNTDDGQKCIARDGEQIFLERDSTCNPPPDPDSYYLNDDLVPASTLNFEFNDASNTIVTTFTLDGHDYSISNYHYEN